MSKNKNKSTQTNSDAQNCRNDAQDCRNNSQNCDHKSAEDCKH